MYVRMQVCMDVCTCAFMHVCLSVCMYMSACVCVSFYLYMFISMYALINICKSP